MTTTDTRSDDLEIRLRKAQHLRAKYKSLQPHLPEIYDKLKAAKPESVKEQALWEKELLDFQHDLQAVKEEQAKATQEFVQGYNLLRDYEKTIKVHS